MRFVMFYHSLVSDWNHGNAHFLRGVVTELQARGHEVVVYEPEDGWSRSHLLEDHGEGAVAAFHHRYPRLRSRLYARDQLNLDAMLTGADVVMVHEWNDPALVGRIGANHAAKPGYRLLFHDTHHRAVSDPAALAAFDLSGYDAVLVFGRVLETIYRQHNWAHRVFTWHEAADTRVFRPLPNPTEKRPATTDPVPDGPSSGAGEQKIDVVWVGNWGEGERTAELQEFLLDPVRELGLRAEIYGVRYPDSALEALQKAGITYRGWLPNFEVPRVFSRARLTVHVPRRYYADSLPGIPTIRPFEALACGIPLICAPWKDSEGLFRPGLDYLVARNGAEMTQHMATLLARPEFASALAAEGRKSLLARHSCAHRVDQLFNILALLDATEATAA